MSSARFSLAACFVGLVALALGALILATPFFTKPNPTEFDTQGFGRLPILVGGRIKPLNTVARTTLLQFQGRQTVRITSGGKLNTDQWLADVLFNGPQADTYQVFEVVHPDLLATLQLTEADGAGKKRFSFAQIVPRLDELDRQSLLARPIEAPQRTRFQKAVVALHDNIALYQRLKHSVMMPDDDDWLGELRDFENGLVAGIGAVRLKERGEPHNEAAAQTTLVAANRFDFMTRTGYLLAVPPPEPTQDDTAWRSVGETLLGTFQSGRLDAHVMAYAGLAHAWRGGNARAFNDIISLYRTTLSKDLPQRLTKTDAETRFKAAQPFYQSMYLYVLAFLCAISSWLIWPRALRSAAFNLTALAFIATTAGIAIRMWLEGRPPVTNLYSSALFVAWGAVGLCLILEWFYKNALGLAAAGMIGFAGLVIAHHLSMSGDTLEMMRAVLDSNFWLATHVIIITIGYSATFLAGCLAILYIFRGVLTRSLDGATGSALERMVYGIICFATLFSLVGTILGGIWADQSWGRFWGWDPKENGALIIVMWNALILHARWGKLVGPRGLMNLAIFGNIVTSWSWFGTNMLGVGLHSYGFMDAAFWALLGFVASQLFLIGLGCLPLHLWRSASTQIPAS
jgi:ABC-type transport system involved in cytochrome c biogenesis permease subunit